MMYCTECGTELPDTAKFCVECGSPTSLAPRGPLSPQPSPLANYIKLAETALKKQNWEEADEYFRKTLEGQAGNTQAWMGRILVAFRGQSVAELLKNGISTVYEGDGSWCDPDRNARRVLPFLENILAANPEMPEAKLLAGYLFNAATLIEDLRKISDVRPIAELALNLLAARYLRYSLTVKHESTGWILKSHHAHFLVDKEDWLKKALRVPGVQGKIDVDEILDWEFPLKYEEDFQIDASGAGGTEVIKTVYLSGSPEGRLNKYLSQRLNLPIKRVESEMRYALSLCHLSLEQ